MNRQQRRAAAQQRDTGPTRPQFAAEGLRHHQAGQFDRAKAFYRKALEVQPDDADALHLLGVLHHQEGDFLGAVELIAGAIALKPDLPEAYNNLGTALAALDRLEEAASAYRHAIARKPNYPPAHNNLGNVLRNSGRFDEALACCRDAIALKPDYPQPHNGLGAALQALGRLAEAEASYRDALRLWPDFPEAQRNLATVLMALGRPEEAVEAYRHAIALAPANAEAHHGLATALKELGKFEEAVACLRQALAIRPDFAEWHNNLAIALGTLGRFEEALEAAQQAIAARPDYANAHFQSGFVLVALGRTEEALDAYHRAVAIRPAYAEAHNNLGIVLEGKGRLDEAVDAYRRAIAIQPDYAEAHCCLATHLLLTGALREGFAEYRWRWQTAEFRKQLPDRACPPWEGENLSGKAILVHCEQGYGDSLQFIRYVRPLSALAARVAVLAPQPLATLFRSIPGIEVITDLAARDDAEDYRIPLLCLPRLFGTALDTIPAATPYLAADPALAAAWCARLAALGGLRVGLVWAGGPLLTADRRRSITLDRMAPLGEVSGVSLVSLQKGEPAAQAAEPPRGMALHDFTAGLADFADTAGLIAELDLVISVDTAVAHLAGALGKPVWLLNRFDTCWRWLLDRDDSPWYPRLRQFRQPRPGDWDSVIGAVRNALRDLAAGDRDQLRPRDAIL